MSAPAMVPFHGRRRIDAHPSPMRGIGGSQGIEPTETRLGRHRGPGQA